MERRESKQIQIGKVPVGGKSLISVQSMTNSDTRNVLATIEQIEQLAAAGCELIRVAVPDTEAAEALKQIKAGISLPLIADIHFDYRLALLALQNGVDGLRINPGNIGSAAKVREVAERAKAAGVPIRIGVNAGSLEKDLLERSGHPTPEVMVESALRHIDLLERQNFDLIKVSLKASDVPLMVEAYRQLASRVAYPLHIGVTEAGTVNSGTVKSAVGIGILLAEGIGDTIRVSLTGHPLHEVRVGFEILKVLGLREKGATLISCPTCGRTEINLIKIAEEVENRLLEVDKPVKVAVMGCVVNGPGEAREADIGIAGGKGVGLVFKKGEIIRKVPEKDLVPALMEELSKL